MYPTPGSGSKLKKTLSGILKDKQDKMSVNNMKYKFERKTLRFRDMFSEVLFYINKFWLHLKCYEPNKVDRMALEMMSES